MASATTAGSGMEKQNSFDGICEALTGLVADLRATGHRPTP